MSLTSRDFPAGTPLRHFFTWNESARRWRDRRYELARDPGRLPPRVAELLAASVGNADIAAHAAVFAAFEKLERAAGAAPRRVLVIRLSALGDFVQALGPIAAIRRHHARDHLSLLTTRPLSAFAEELGWFDDVLIGERPGPFAIAGWLGLRRRLRQGRFDRVYDLQTSHRSAAYAWLLRPGMPEWSGIAWRCSHPHANLERDDQHTLDKQAEQLLMAGIHPTPLPALPPLDRPLPRELAGRDFALLVPGSSPQHPEKRWPAERFGELARALAGDGYVPVVIGTPPEAPLAATIRALCPEAVGLVGRTDLGLLAALAQHAALTVGNDTGVCHLAAAAGCPLIVLFSGGTDPARCAPRGRLVRVLAAPHATDLAADSVIVEARAILPSTPTDRLETASPAKAGVHSSATPKLQGGSRLWPGLRKK
jgi:ADP-heptose:LPS heptosyltransferase